MRLVMAILVLCNVGLAQDWVRLDDGSRIMGEIVQHDEETLAIIDRLGKRHELTVGDVVKHKKGRALAKSLAKKLEGLVASDVEGLYAVAKEALAVKRHKSDAKRLMRRVLALDFDHEGARAALGHVRALEQWFMDEKKAARAVAAHYKKRGFVQHEGGWVEPDHVSKIEASPSEWMVEGKVWREVRDVMTERGYLEFRGEWLPPAESDYVRHAAAIEEGSELVLGGGQFESVVVLHFQGREKARALAQQLFEARQWYAAVYDAPESAVDPLQIEVILETSRDFAHFRETVGEEYGASPSDDRPGGEDGGTVTGVGFNPFLGGVRHVELPALPEPPGGLPGGVRMDLGFNPILDSLPHSLIFAMAHIQTTRTWGGDARKLPYFMAHANAVHAEIAALGKTIVHESTVDTEYGRSTGNDAHGNLDADHSKMKELLRATLKKRTMSLRTLFFADGIQMDSGLDQLGVVFLTWLRELHSAKLIAFMSDPDRLETIDARFERHFEMSFEEAETAFRKWLG